MAFFQVVCKPFQNWEKLIIHLQNLTDHTVGQALYKALGTYMSIRIQILEEKVST